MNTLKKLIFGGILLVLTASLLTSCNFFGKKKRLVIEVVELDQLPMYGSTAMYGNQQKSDEQMEADKVFLQNSDKLQASRALACIDYIDMGWFHLHQGDTEVAMRRANQAWQLNSTNPDVYTLFAGVLNARTDHEGALDMLDRAINIKPDFVYFYELYLQEGIELYKQNGNDTEIRRLLILLNNVEIESDSTFHKIEKIRQDTKAFLNH